MKISIVSVKIEEKEKLWGIFQKYLHELSQHKHIEKDNKGQYIYKYFDNYWQDKGRFPFFILNNGQIIGLIFINNYSVISDETNLHAIAEFYVVPDYRKQGIGREALTQVFSKFKGKWEVDVIGKNKDADIFWGKTINTYTKGDFKKQMVNNEKWNGFVYEFNNEKYR